jgi:hypothetical protein
MMITVGTHPLFEKFLAFDRAYQLGDVASLIALAITIVGFAITIWQIQKSRTASEQARDAAHSARQQILRMNAVAELGVIIRDLQEIQGFHRDNTLSALPGRYTSVKLALIAVKGRTPELTERQQSEIQAAVQQIAGLEQTVEEAIAGTNILQVSRINRILRQQIERLAAISVDLQTENLTL